MNKTVWIAVAIAIAIGTFVLARHNSQPDLAATPPDAVTDSVWSEPEISNALSSDVETAFKLDIDRLFDVSYEVDPGLVEFAASIGKSPACVIDIAKSAVHGQQPNPPRCPVGYSDKSVESMVLLPGTYETVCSNEGGREHCRRIKVADHPYEMYSDDELQSLSSSSPEAAIILARRLADDTASEHLYEQAVTLSGRPGPLEEWMLHRNAGGLVRNNGELDLEKALVGYEIYLTTARLGYGLDAVREYEQVLSQENVDLAAAKTRADARFERLTEFRKSLVGDDWEEEDGSCDACETYFDGDEDGVLDDDPVDWTEEEKL